MNKPFFSFIVLAYNNEKYIENAINSILNQSFSNHEIIIINNNSSDNTLFIIENLINNNGRIVLLNNLENKSQHIARKEGVEYANGKYLLFLDGDDYLENNILDDLCSLLLIYPDYDLLEFGYREQPSGKEIYPKILSNNRFLDFFETDEIIYSVCNKVYKIELIKKAFSYMENKFITNAEDMYESIIISFYSQKYISINKILYNYVTGIGISTTYKDYYRTIQFLESINTVFICLHNFITKNELHITLDFLKYRFLKFTIDHYIIPNKSSEEQKKLFKLLINYYEPYYFIELLELKYLENIKIENELSTYRKYSINKLLITIIKKLKKYSYK